MGEKFIAMMLIKKFYMLLMNINYIAMNTQILFIIWQNVVSQRLKRLMNYIEPNITFLMPIATEQSSLDEFTDKKCE